MYLLQIQALKRLPVTSYNQGQPVEETAPRERENGTYSLWKRHFKEVKTAFQGNVGGVSRRLRRHMQLVSHGGKSAAASSGFPYSNYRFPLLKPIVRVVQNSVIFKIGQHLPQQG